ncbi:MAG: ABC transporter permease [Bryobacterales bacterium]
MQRYRSLTIKEFQQLRRNRRLLIQLIVPPTVVLVIFGFALNPEVSHLRTGIVDESRTPQSRELISALTEIEAFDVTAYYGSASDAEAALRRLELDLAIIVPASYADSLHTGRPARVQVLVDAVNANSAAIARGYLAQATADYNGKLLRRRAGQTSARVQMVDSRAQQMPDLRAEAIVLYNPGMIHAWFFVSGVIGVLMFLNSALVGSAAAVREKELGTIEQLLMSPAQTIEMLAAKTTPVLVVVTGDLLLALLAAWLVFDLPVRGSLPLLLLAGMLAAVAGTGVGITLATFSSTQQQAQLLTFFLMPPLVLLSGAFAPVETMPQWLQYVSWIDPLRYLLVLVRGIALKGAGLTQLWEPLAILAVFAVVLYGVSAARFRRQLG